jgi:protein TonB
LSRFIASKLVYPNTAVTNRVEGVVVVGFIVDQDGKVRQPRIIKSLYPACDEEALRVVRLIPEWIPARNKNRTVSFNYRMPIEFRLNR